MAKNDTYENHLDLEESKWFAVYTRYKREKMVFKALQQKGIECYLPIQKTLRQWERKRKWVELPLINCYVFVKITKPAYIPVLETENVVRFVQFSRNLISIPSEEISLLKKILREETCVQTKEITYVEGDIVEIISGNLLGLRGKLIKKQGKTNFLVELHNIGYAFQMEVDATILRKVNPVVLEQIHLL